MSQHNQERRTILRQPSEETSDLYPGLCVCDGRVSGSITASESRLPLWAIVGVAVEEGWEEVEEGWPQINDYGWTKKRMSDFLYYLLEPRGEFARLLLLLAEAERLSQIEGNIAWHRDEALRQRVREQLQRCLDTLQD